MKRSIFGFLLLFVLGANCAFAQNEVKLRNIECVNLGDGRLFCKDRETENPLQGKSRIIDGYTTQYIETEFKNGIPNGSWKVYKYNALTEEYNYSDGLLNGTYKEYYSDGSVKESRNYIKGKPDGKFISYDQHGKVSAEKSYKNGLEDGPDIKYDAEGKIRSETRYINGKAQGKSTQQISSNGGDYTITCNYSDGVYDGEYAEIFTNGTIKTKGKYIKGKKDGTWEYNKKDGQKIRTDGYSNDDKIKETIYYTDGTVEVVRELKNGKKNGYERKYTYGDGSLKSELYYQDGELASTPATTGNSSSKNNSGTKSGMVKQTKQIASNEHNYTQTFYQINGKYEGEYLEQYTDGGAIKAKGQYSNGQKQGVWVYEDIRGRKAKEETYSNGKLNGLRTRYNEGIIEESQEYKDDVKNGEYKKYNAEGKLVLKGNFQNDKRHGPAEEYYSSGKIESKCSYDRGLVNGIEQTFYSNGKMKSETTYLDGNVKGPFKTWDENGQLETEGEYLSKHKAKYKNTYKNGKLYMKEYLDENNKNVVEHYDENGKKTDW